MSCLAHAHQVPRRLTEETVRGDTAAVPLVTYDFLDFKVGPQVCFSTGLTVVLLHPTFGRAEVLEGTMACYTE